jgi:predicted PolB exonuclease-like 3'-5' exonuclease
MATAETAPRMTREAVVQTAYLILDTESIPDGRLLARIKYPDDSLTPEAAIERAQAEARAQSATGSDFLPVSFHLPIGLCVIRVAADYSLLAVTSLDAPQYRPREIVTAFWQGLKRYKAKLVTFNGRGFDLPLLELGAFRYGCSNRDYFSSRANRYGNNGQGNIDLCDWLNNFGACRLTGGLDLFSKILGKPGKMSLSGDQVYSYYLAGRLQEINDYCMFDTLDTYFVFLRSRVMTGDLNLEQEFDLVQKAKQWLIARVPEMPALQQYLDNWGDWDPWP